MTDSKKETGCLIVERRVLEDIVIGDDVRVRITAIDKGRVKIAVIAPKDLPIVREGGKGERRVI